MRIIPRIGIAALALGGVVVTHGWAAPTLAVLLALRPRRLWSWVIALVASVLAQALAAAMILQAPSPTRQALTIGLAIGAAIAGVLFYFSGRGNAAKEKAGAQLFRE